MCTTSFTRREYYIFGNEKMGEGEWCCLARPSLNSNVCDVHKEVIG